MAIHSCVRILIQTLRAMSWCGVCLQTLTPAYGDDTSIGKDIYQRHCVKCHGNQGEGTEGHYPKTLTGDRTIPQLARFIATSMPPEEAGILSSDESQRVAEYIHATFYSQEAQLKRQPPRRETTRLTGRQFAHSIADLMVSFYGPAARSTDHGLKGDYATINSNGDGKQVFSRLDPQVSFDFMRSSPKPDEIDPAEFAISWVGSIRPPVSGEYEFIIRSPNSFKLHVNDRKNALIDGWVISGERSDYRATLELLAGHHYPLQLYFTKAGQGVKKPDELREKISPASIVLAWKPPGRTEEIIPAAYLSPVETRETLIIQTRFPPDDRSTGVERGTSVSAEWDQATTYSAIEATDHVISHLGDLCGIVEPTRENEATVKEFCVRFAERTFGRPLTPQQKILYIDRQFANAPDMTAAIERIVLMVLKSPRFLYTELPGIKPDQFTAAARLSLSIWDSLPDEVLLSAATSGQLGTHEQIADHARRMAADRRLENKLHEFFIQWLKVEKTSELLKDRTLFPEFNTSIATDLRTSLELFLEDVLDDDQVDFRQFLVADFLYLNRRLAPLYQVSLLSDETFHKITMNPDERAGVLTHPYMMAVFSDAKTSSPIRRGVFLSRSVLGRTLRPPPDAVTPIAPELNPHLTTRERTTLQTSAESCQSCHSLINPLGFSLERYDAVGRLRDKESDRAIDALGSYESRAGVSFQFNGGRELARFLSESDEVSTALIEKLFYFSTQQPIRAYGADVLPRLRRDFVDHGFELRHLMASIAVVVATAGDQLDSSAEKRGE